MKAKNRNDSEHSVVGACLHAIPNRPRSPNTRRSDYGLHGWARMPISLIRENPCDHSVLSPKCAGWSASWSASRVMQECRSSLQGDLLGSGRVGEFRVAEQGVLKQRPTTDRVQARSYSEGRQDVGVPRTEELL